MEKINVEEEKRLITSKTYLDKIESTQVYHENLIDRKKELVSVLKNQLLPMGMSIASIKTLEAEIKSVLEDELLDDLYDADPIFKDIKQYMKDSHHTFLLQEQFIQILSQFILEFLTIANDITPISITPQNSNIDDGTPTLSLEEKEKLKKISSSLILHYKHQTTSAKKKVLANRLLYFADTKEKYKIINDIFFDIVGERVLDKLKKVVKNSGEGC